MNTAEEILRKMESLNNISRPEALRQLRRYGLMTFSEAMILLSKQRFPKLASILPIMTPDDITKRWTGNSGAVVMVQGVSFARACSDHYAMISGSSMREKRILDFGCGYGRFLRLFSYYSDEVYGVDAWDSSLDLCRQAGLGDWVGKTEVILDKIPHTGTFDFLSAFSVFTHLSEKAAIAALMGLRRSAKVGAIFAITIRPPGFWEFAANGSLKTRANEARSMLLKHNMDGYAYLPSLQSSGNMLDHFGQTSISLDWFERNSFGWQVRSTDGSFDDPQQRYVFLQAV